MYKFDENECYVKVEYGSSTAEQVSLPCYPEEVSESVAATWQQQSALGRVGSLFAYTGTQDVACSFSFDMHMEILQQVPLPTNSSLGREVNDSSLAEEEFNKCIAVLKSTSYPKYTEGGIQPPRTTFVFGAFKIRGRVERVDIQWKTPIIDKKYAIATVNVSMYSASVSILGSNSIISTNSLYPRGHHFE